jgi:hypothetical protein
MISEVFLVERIALKKFALSSLIEYLSIDLLSLWGFLVNYVIGLQSASVGVQAMVGLGNWGFFGLAIAARPLLVH